MPSRPALCARFGQRAAPRGEPVTLTRLLVTGARTAGRGGSRARAPIGAARARRAPGAARPPRPARGGPIGTAPRAAATRVRNSSSTRSASTSEPKTCGPASLRMRRWPRSRRSSTAAGRPPRPSPGSATTSTPAGSVPGGAPRRRSVVRTSGASASTARSGGIDPEAVRIATRGRGSRPSSRRSSA